MASITIYQQKLTNKGRVLGCTSGLGKETSGLLIPLNSYNKIGFWLNAVCSSGGNFDGVDGVALI